MLKSTRQQYHRQIGQVLAEHFPETVEAQPELVAHHYTEAGLIEQALPHWQKAGERATQRSAYVEAIAHLTKGLERLKTLPDTPERPQQELTLHFALSDALITIKGDMAPYVEKPVTRARALCQQLGETPQLVPMLVRLWLFYFIRGDVQTAHKLAEQRMRLAQRVQDPYLLAGADGVLGVVLYYFGELTSARTHLEEAIAYDPQQHPRFTFHTADPRIDWLSYVAHILWHLGYSDQALERSQESLVLAAGLSHPFSLTYASVRAALLHSFRREGQRAREQAEAGMSLATEQGFPFWVAFGRGMRDCALAEQGYVPESLTKRRHSRAPFALALLAAAYAKVGRVEEGLSVVAEALAFVDKTGVRYCEAELVRLKGELTLQSQVSGPRATVAAEAEECFHQAIAIARGQSAKSWELRAVMSLARLWLKEGKKDEARQLLAEISGWFTEGFDTKDLQEAKALLEELSH